MMKDRKLLNREEQVTTILLNHSGIKAPKSMPRIIAIISLGIRPIFNLLFSMVFSPYCILSLLLDFKSALSLTNIALLRDLIKYKFITGSTAEQTLLIPDITVSSESKPNTVALVCLRRNSRMSAR